MEKLNGSRCTVVTLKLFFEMLVVISIWQEQSRDFGENKGKRSAKKTDIKIFTFHTLKKKKEIRKYLEESAGNSNFFNQI